MRTDVTDIKLRDHVEVLEEGRRAALGIDFEKGLDSVDPTMWVVRIYNDSDDMIGTIFFADPLRSPVTPGAPRT